MDKNITIGIEYGDVDKWKTEKETERKKERAKDEGEFIASARLHARKFDKDVV